MDVRLEVVHDKSRIRHVRLRRDTVVGRAKDCQLRIPVADVSRQHCQFTLDGERLLLRDLGSSNGTQLGDRTIPPGKDILLADGDTITVGPVSFIIHLSKPDETAPTSETQAPPQHSSLQDTAEFPRAGLLAEDPIDFDSDEQPAAATATTPDTELAPERPAQASTLESTGLEDTPDAGVLADDDPSFAEDASVVELELSSSVDIPSSDDDLSAAESAVEDPPEKPLKSRSLFGLFRRRAATTSGDGDVRDDDLMEEPGADPPADPDSEIDSDELHDGAIAAVQSDTVDDVSVDEAAEPDPTDSVFDDDTPAEEPLGHDPPDEGDIEEIAEEGDAISFDFLQDESDNDDDAADDNNLGDFLGQFGD